MCEGDKIECRLNCNGDWLEVIETYLPKEAWVEAIQQVGFEPIKWQLATVTAAGIAKQGEAFWTDYLDLPGALYFTVSRPK